MNLDSSHDYHTTLEELGNVALDVAISIMAYSGDPGVMRDRHGHGYPPLAPDADLLGVRVETVYGDDYKLSRAECGEWIADLDRIALARVESRWESVFRDRALEDANEAACS